MPTHCRCASSCRLTALPGFEQIAAVRDTARRSAEAADRIRPFVRETPLVLSPAFSDSAGAEVWFKLENRQHTGSFKFRGAINRLLTLPVHSLLRERDLARLERWIDHYAAN